MSYPIQALKVSSTSLITHHYKNFAPLELLSNAPPQIASPNRVFNDESALTLQSQIKDRCAEGGRAGVRGRGVRVGCNAGNGTKGPLRSEEPSPSTSGPPGNKPLTPVSASLTFLPVVIATRPRYG